MTKAKDEKRLYRDLAWLFPIVTPLEDYLEETELFVQTIRKHSRIPVHTLLHLGCGAGHNDYVFKKHFAVTGADMSRSMLNLARKLNPEAAYVEGDMRALSIGRTFDSVAAIDSLAYMTTGKDLRKAFQTAYAHLNPGGIFFFFVEQTKESFKQNNTVTSTHRQDDVDVTFIENLYDPDPADSSYESTFIYLIRRGGKQEIHTDMHVCGMFPVDVIEGLVRDVGFNVTRLTYAPPESAVAHSGLSGQESFPMFLCLKPA